MFTTKRRFSRAPLAALRAVACAALLLPLSAATHSRQQQQKPPAQQQPDEDVVKIDSALMQAGVTVLDKQGRFVGGLKAEQFEVLVDGKPQAVSFFEQVAAGSPEERAKLARAGDARARAASRPGAEPQARGRAIIFFLDDLHMPPESVTQARKLIEHFVDKEMSDDDLAAVASASGQLGFLQQLTSNRDVLRAAAARLRPWPQSGSDGQQPPMSEYVAKAIDVEYDRDALEIYVQALLRENVRRPTAELMVKTRARTILERANTYTRNTLRSLGSMVRAVSPMPGRKLAFFLSDGFLLSRNESSVADALRDITDAAVRAGVVLYTMDTRGLATDAWLDASGSAPPDGTGSIARVEVGSMTASQEALHVIAEQTGGRAILNTNAQAASLSRTVNETAAYYLLAWRPGEGEQHAGKFRHLDVTVKGRPELTVLVQRGFLEGPAASAGKRAGGESKQPKQGGELTAALAAAVPVREVPANLSLGYELSDKGEALVTALVSVPLDALAADATGKAAVEVAGYVVNLEGKIGARFAEKLSVTPSQSTPGPDGRGYVLYRHQVKVAPGLYQIRAAALDVNSGRAGSAAEWVEVPDLKSRGLTLGSLKVGERPADTSQPYNVENFVAQRSAERRFKRDTPLRLMTYIYNAQGARPDLEAEVKVLRAGSPVLTYHFDVDPGADPARGIAFGAEVPLDALAPGRYVLQLTVTNRSARGNASGRTLFTVE
jgi:VWFA-related protein